MNGRQELFVSYYTEGDTIGNCEQSMLKAGYKAGYARKWSGCFIRAIRGIKEAVDKRIKEIINYQEATIEIVDMQFMVQYQACVEAKDRTNAVRILENRAKHVGFYKEDNLQRAEQTKLEQAEAEEAGKIANILNLEDARKGKSA